MTEHAHKHDSVGASIDGLLPGEEVFTRLQAGSGSSSSASASLSSSKSDSDVGSYIAFRRLKSPRLIDPADASQSKSSLAFACVQGSNSGPCKQCTGTMQIPDAVLQDAQTSVSACISSSGSNSDPEGSGSVSLSATTGAAIFVLTLPLACTNLASSADTCRHSLLGVSYRGIHQS